MNDYRHILFMMAVILAMALVGVVGYRSMPKPDLQLPPVENCRLDREVCASTLPTGGRVEVAIEPRPVPTSKPLTLSVVASGVAPAGIEMDFAGVGMNMGYNRSRLEPAGGGRYTGQATLPVCITGSMAWRATVLIDTGRQIVSVPFRFETRHE